jgi:hypothetical protein
MPVKRGHASPALDNGQDQKRIELEPGEAGDLPSFTPRKPTTASSADSTLGGIDARNRLIGRATSTA